MRPCSTISFASKHRCGLSDVLDWLERPQLNNAMSMTFTLAVKDRSYTVPCSDQYPLSSPRSELRGSGTFSIDSPNPGRRHSARRDRPASYPYARFLGSLACQSSLFHKHGTREAPVAIRANIRRNLRP